uniref:ABC transporter ATP-binding protein n=1 Tax=Eiseniibacteriota bacterium TaxID=2212470 RepID=A0A832MLC6_UNCEI
MPADATAGAGDGARPAAPGGADAAATGAATGVEVIRLEHVTRVFKVGDSEVRALDGVSLSVRAGEYLSLMGPSGSGKSTLLNVLGCLDTPTSGRYVLDGEPVEKLTEDQLADVRQRKIGFIFQAYHLVARMSAARNVELPMIFAGVAPAERRARAREALVAVGLGHRLDHRPDQLSGGERQRVAIARATAMRPRILLADEPTGNLDTRSGDEILALLERLNAEGLTLVVVTHDPRVGGRAQRRLRMRDGRMAEDG